MKFLICILLIFCSLKSYAYQIPKDNKVTFDIIRKNKIIGSHSINFLENGDELQITTNIKIEVKILFFPAYDFSHSSTEKWINDEFIQFEGHTDFEDEREYFIKGKVEGDQFLASGMDGDISVNKNILPSNFWNINIFS